MKASATELKMRSYLKGSFMDYWCDVKQGRNAEYTSRIYFAQKEMYVAVFPKTDIEKLENRWMNEYRKGVEND